MSKVTAGHHPREARPEVLVVLGDVIALLELVERDLELRPARCAEHRNLGAHRRARIALLAKSQNLLLRDMEAPRRRSSR